MIPVRPGKAEAESLQRLEGCVFERVRENTAGEVLGVVVIDVPVAKIGDPVENAQGVAEDTIPQVAGQLRPDIAVRDEIGRQPAFNKERLRHCLQTFQANWGLVFSYA